MITWPPVLHLIAGAVISSALAAGITYLVVLTIRALKRWGK